MPVLRPLVGMDKEEITAEAQRLGTYPISIIPDQDCCTLFTPQASGDHARGADEVERAEAALPIDEIVAQAVAGRGAWRSSRFPDTYQMSRFTGYAGDDNVKITPGKLAGMKAVSDDARRDRRRGHGPARLAAEVARQGEGRRRRRPRDGGVQDPRHRSADPARQRDPARSRVGPPGEQAPREGRRPAAGLREDRLRRDQRRAGCPICSTTGRCGASRKPAPTASRSCSTTRRSIRRTINDLKHAWVERIGDECRANDIPFFLEFIGYEEGADEKGLEFAKKKPEIVTGSMAEFTKDRYGVDVHEGRMPINMKFVEGTQAFGGQKAYTKQEAMDALPAHRGGRDQAVHLPVGRRQQRGVHRDARARRRSRHAVLGRAVRPRDVEGRDSGLRQAGRRRVPRRGSRPRASRTSSNVNARLEAGASVVRVLRREVGRRIGITHIPRSKRKSGLQEITSPEQIQLLPRAPDLLLGSAESALDVQRRSVSTPLTLPRQVSPEYGTRIESIAELGRARQRDRAATSARARVASPGRSSRWSSRSACPARCRSA